MVKEDSTKNSPARRGNPSDIIMVLVLAILAVISAFALPDGNIVRILLGLPLLLFIPGYCAVSALWPEKYNLAESEGETPSGSGSKTASKGIDSLERVVLSCGLSIALVVFAGVVLNFLWEITLLAVSVLLLVISLALSVATWLRRAALPRGSQFSWSFATAKNTLCHDKIGTSILASLIAVGVVLSFLIATAPESSAYTEFYMLDQNFHLRNLPTNLSVNETGIVNIGIINNEGSVVNYTVVAGMENATQANPNLIWSQMLNATADHTVIFDATIADQEKLEKQFQFHFNEPGIYKITWNLYIEGEATDYELHIWVNVA